MSNVDAKIKHSIRIGKTKAKINKQVKIAKAYGIKIDEPNRFSKKHATNCGNPKCWLCSNPRKLFKERTLQERKFIAKAKEEI